MSARVVVLRRVSPARLRLAPRVLSPARSIPRPDFWARLANDRDLVGVKLLMVAGLLLIMMALEVPW